MKKKNDSRRRYFRAVPNRRNGSTRRTAARVVYRNWIGRALPVRERSTSRTARNVTAINAYQGYGASVTENDTTGIVADRRGGKTGSGFRPRRHSRGRSATSKICRLKFRAWKFDPALVLEREPAPTRARRTTRDPPGRSARWCIRAHLQIT